jgi:hypothetical protein
LVIEAPREFEERNNMNRLLTPAIALVALVTGLGSANAAPLGLTQKYPDIATTPITVEYDADFYTATEGRLRILRTGVSMPFDVNGGAFDSSDYLINGGTASYSLNARIRHDGTLVAGANSTLSISGDLKKNVFLAPTENSGLALSGNLAEFGFGAGTSGGSVIEFRFLVTGGYLQTRGFFGNSGEIIVSSATGSFGASPFTTDFTWTNARADTFVPTPASAAAGSVLLSGLMCRRRQRQA